VVQLTLLRRARPDRSSGLSGWWEPCTGTRRAGWMRCTTRATSVTSAARVTCR